MVDDLFPRRRRVLVEEGLRRHHEAGRAEAALEREALDEGPLDRVQLVVATEPLHGHDLVAIGVGGEEGARADRPAVDEHGAGPADLHLAADLRPGQAQLVTQQLGQRPAGFDVEAERAAVDRRGDLDGDGVHAAPASDASARRTYDARDMALVVRRARQIGDGVDRRPPPRPRRSRPSSSASNDSWALGHRADHDPPADSPVLVPLDRGDADGGALGDLVLEVGRAAGRVERDLDPHEQLVGLPVGRERPHDEVVDGQRPLLPDANGARPPRRGRRAPWRRPSVARRSTGCPRACPAPAPVRCRPGRALPPAWTRCRVTTGWHADVVMGGDRAHVEHPTDLLDAGELGQALEVDEHGWAQQPGPHRSQRLRAAGVREGVVADRAQGLLDGGRPEQGERGEPAHASSRSAAAKNSSSSSGPCCGSSRPRGWRCAP